LAYLKGPTTARRHSTLLYRGTLLRAIEVLILTPVQITLGCHAAALDLIRVSGWIFG